MSFDSNDVINGTFGTAYDEDGKEVQGTQEFEAIIEYDKAKIKIPRQLMNGNKVTSASGSGSMKLLKIDSRLQQKVAENPTAKYNYIGKLNDPTARGEEAILIKGVSFDKVPLIGYKLGELVEVDLDFTFDDFEYLDSIS